MNEEIDLELLRTTARGYLAAPRSATDIAKMGWTGLLVDEASGGAGWRPVEAAVIAEELGRAQNATSWDGSTLCAAALAQWGDTDLRDRWLPGLLDGSVTGAVTIGFAPRAVGAPHVVVACGDDGLRFIDGSDAVAAQDHASLDTRRDVRALAVPEAQSTIGHAAAAATIAGLLRVLVAADALGVLTAARERLVEYLRSRDAFGQPVASFQAIQHRLVDLLVFESRARAIIARAAREAAEDGTAFPRSAAVAHAFVAAGVVPAVDECIQLSGAIGFTWEYPLHHELRRALADTTLAGTARLSRSVVAEEGGW